MDGSVTEHVRQAQAVSAARTRAIVFPAVLAAILFAAIVYIQFSLVLGKNSFPAELLLAVGFYYCWNWHVKLQAKAKALAAKR